MKLGTLLLTGSLAANIAFVAWLCRRPTYPAVKASAPTAAASPASRGSISISTAQASALQSADLAEMKAAGIPNEVANILAAGRAYRNLTLREQARKKLRLTDSRYWRNTWTYEDPADERQDEKKRLEEEFDTAMKRAFPELAEDEEDRGVSRSTGIDRYAGLSDAVREKLTRIEKDYNEIESEMHTRVKGGILLPSDEAKLKLLREEKRRDIAAALSPAELENLQLRDTNSETFQAVRSNYGNAIESEADFRKVFGLQRAFDERFSSGSGKNPDARDAAYAELRADILEVVGEKSYAAYQREHDNTYRALTAITRRLALPRDTPDQVYAARDRYAAQSQIIARDPSLSPEAQSARLKTLGEIALSDLQATLGSEGAEVYAGRANWLIFLKQGEAFSTDPKDAPQHTNVGVTDYRLPRRRRP